MLERLQQDYEDKGKLDLFERLKVFLTVGDRDDSYRQIAAELGPWGEAAIARRAALTAFYDHGGRDGRPLDSTSVRPTQIQSTTLATSYRPA